MRFFRRLAAESLEHRALLSSAWTITADFSGPLVNLTFQEDPASTGGGFLNLWLDEDGNLACDFPGSQDPPSLPGTFPIHDIGHIWINATGGTDWLVLDFTNGSPVPVEGVDFSGGEDGGIGDIIELFAYDVASLGAVPTSRVSGTVHLDGGFAVTFSQTEWLLLAGTAEELAIDLSQTGVPDADVFRVRAHAGAGYSVIEGPALPVTQFVNPTSGLTIDFEASGGSGSDTVNVEGLWPTFDAGLTINGGSDDTVNFQTNATNLGPSGGDLIVTAGTINIGQELTVSGSVVLDAAADITLQAAGRLTASGPSVALRASGEVMLESGARVQTAGGDVSLDSGAAISMAKGSVIDAGGGDVSLRADYGVLLSRVVSPGATITIDAGRGGIADGADPADPPDADGADLEAERAVLRAEGSIGSRAENTPWGTVVVRLDTKLQRLDAVSANGVGIFLVNDGPLVIERAEAGRAESPLGIVDIVTMSALTLSAAAGFTLDAGETDSGTPDRFDVNADGAVTALDALLVIEDLHHYGPRRLERLTAESAKLDVNRDAQLSPQDVLQIINHLNRQASSPPGASPSAPAGVLAAPRAKGEFTPAAAPACDGVTVNSRWSGKSWDRAGLSQAARLRPIAKRPTATEAAASEFLSGLLGCDDCV